MIEYHYQDVERKGDIAILLCESSDEHKRALSMLKKFYPNVQFELVNQFCMDCE